MAGETHRITLAFLDPQLERAYREKRARRYLGRQTVIGYVVTGVVWLCMAAYVNATYEHHPAMPAVRLLWLCTGALLVACAGVIRWGPRERLVPWVPHLSVAVAFVGSAVSVATVLVGESFAAIATSALAMYLICVHTFMGLRFVEASVASGLLALAHFVVLVFCIPVSASAMLTAGVFLGFSQLFGMLMSHRDERYRRRDFQQVTSLAEERAKSERLLANMLPAPIAERLKESEAVIADAHGDVTVLFADLVGFTVLSGRVPPAELVELLDRVFTAFDALADRLGLEKIKTIGDAYMVVGGLPTPRADHVAAVVEMAFQMRAAVSAIRPELGLALRIGIHKGPVVAGVIGKRKYTYDLWGDTVNTASRMESHGAPNRIHVSESVRAGLDARYVVEARGMVEIKGKGPMSTFWVVGSAERQAATE